MLEVPKEEAKSLRPVKELSLLMKLPYLGVRGLRGEMGLVKLAYKWTEFCEPKFSLAQSSKRRGGDGGSGRLGLFMIFFLLPNDCKGLSGILTKVKTVAIVNVMEVKM